MNFVQAEFPAFLAIVLAVYWALPSRRAQNVLLVVASGVFVATHQRRRGN